MQRRNAAAAGRRERRAESDFRSVAGADPRILPRGRYGVGEETRFGGRPDSVGSGPRSGIATAPLPDRIGVCVESVPCKGIVVIVAVTFVFVFDLMMRKIERVFVP